MKSLAAHQVFQGKCSIFLLPQEDAQLTMMQLIKADMNFVERNYGIKVVEIKMYKNTRNLHHFLICDKST